MNYRSSTCGLAVSAAFAAMLPLQAEAAPTVSFSRPLANATVSGNISQSSACEVTGDRIDRVRFYVISSSGTSTALNVEENARWLCNINTRNFADGSYTLRAVAYDSAGATATANRTVTIQNGTTTTPTPSGTAPTLSFQMPAEGGPLSGNVQGPPNCVVTGTNIARVMFYINGVWTNTDGNLSNGLGCWIDTTRYQNGPYTLTAVAYNAAGATATATRSIVIQNGTTTPVNPPPTVSLTAPTAGVSVSGTITCAADATDNTSVASVRFSLDGATLVTDTAAPYTCSLDTTQLTNGTHTLMAVATDSQGATATTQRSFTVNNTPLPGPTGTPTPGPTLPSTGTRAINTFESIGLYWTPPSNPGAAGCQVRYRQSGAADWKEALPMWYDSRNSECRGSIVHLTPGTRYDVQFSLPGETWSRELTTSTWSDSFPIAQVVYLTSGSSQINITEGGTASGYVLYTAAPGTSATLDVANNADYNIAISAPYVIVRGLTLRGARIDGIRLLPGARDVVIEDNDISGWGRYSATTSAGWQTGVDRDSGIRAVCSTSNPFLERTVVQRNKIHDPRYGANSWDWGHPEGPQAITYSYCGGNHVMRYNEIYSSDEKHYFNDAISGEDNFSAGGFPNSDTDIYGNKISHTWDDGIEAEGGNRNVRIWGNYIDQTATGIASTVVHNGPLYIFRNVYNRSRMYSQRALDSDDRNSFFKSGAAGGYGNGRRWVFHNTSLQAVQAGVANGLGAGAGLTGNSNQPMTNTVSRNNIFHVWKSSWVSVGQQSGSTGNDADYDLYNGNLSSFAGAEVNGIVGTPTYGSGHGWSNGAGGYYQLAPESAGYDRGARLPNFNDNFTGAAPDVGAHETGAPAMKFGIQ